MRSCLPIHALKKSNLALPIDTPFQLPAALPSWPPGGGFAKGSVNLGGFEVSQVTTFTKVWIAKKGGPDDVGATFYKPSSIPDGFFILGHYAQPNNQPLFGWVLVGRDAGYIDSMAEPVDYKLIWSSVSSNTEQDVHGYFWLPVPPKGYKALGIVVTTSQEKPSFHEIRCVRSELTEEFENGGWIWSNGNFSVSGLRPVNRGTNATGVRVGTFIAQLANASDPNSSSSSSAATTLACLKNNEYSKYSCMPNLSQIQALMQVYAPLIYFHPDEEYLASSVSWFFDNGAILYDNSHKKSHKIDSNGSNLPQKGSNDGAYCIDLPSDDKQRQKLMKGDLSSSRFYLHIKPMLGGTFTDVVLWIFYPFNGPAKIQITKWVKNMELPRIGEHVGDWEHVTLRISNLNGHLWAVYFGQHSSGEWHNASQLEYQGGNKVVSYSSWHGHAMYSKPGVVLQGDTKSKIGIMNDAAKGTIIDTGKRYDVVCAEYLGENVVSEPGWLNYMREWGPKISYNLIEIIEEMFSYLPSKVRATLEKILKGLPAEVLGEEGPTGPKEKVTWSKDEK